MKIITTKALWISVIPSLIGIAMFNTATANPVLHSQRCELGSTCSIPGNDGGETYYTITPKDGQNYRCEIKSKGDSLKIWVGDGKDFSLEKGGGLYNANPNATIEISGRFKNPNDSRDEGQIKFKQMPLSSEGEVKCSPIK